MKSVITRSVTIFSCFLLGSSSISLAEPGNWFDRGRQDVPSEEAAPEVEAEAPKPAPAKPSPAVAESASAEVDKPLKKSKRSRAVASVGPDSDAAESDTDSGRAKLRGKVRRSKRGPTENNVFRIGLLSGIASIASADNTAGSLLNISLNVDYQQKYWGVEVDGYYGLGMGGTAVSGASNSVSQYGLLTSIKGKTTFRLGGGMRLIPKVGVGFGLLSVTNSGTSSDGGTPLAYSASQSVSGVFVTTGMDLVLAPWVFVSADYAMSVVASGNAQNSVGADSDSAALTGANFQRLRVGVNFPVTNNIILGGQYLQRNLASSSSSSPQSFVLAHIGYQW